MDPLAIGGILLIILMLLYLYKCIGLNDENRHKNIKSFKKYSRTISGNNKKTSDKNKDGELVTLAKPIRRRFFLLLWGIEKVSYYDFIWSEEKNVSELTPEEKNRIEWGDPKVDSKVVITRMERTNHHRDRADYQIIITDLETGLPEDATKVTTIQTPQNVKVKLRFNVTMECVNANYAEYRTGGGTVKWFTSLRAIMNTAAGDLVGSGTYTDLIKLRGEKIDDKVLHSTPLTFKDYINKQMLEVKELGMKAVAIDFMDYEVMPESKAFIDALANLAKSEVDKKTADNKAYATNKRLTPFVDKAKELIQKYQEAIIAIKNQPDVTLTQSTEHLSGLKFLGGLNSQGQTGQNAGTEMPDIKTIMDFLTAQFAKEEIEKS